MLMVIKSLEWYKAEHKVCLDKLEKLTKEKDDLNSKYIININKSENLISDLQNDKKKILAEQNNIKKKFEDKNNVKVVVDQNQDALYFSREPIPSPWKGWENIPKYMQTGIIAFRRKALLRFNAIEDTSLEQCESVDMNRILETGGSIRMLISELNIFGVDTAEELVEAERRLKSDPTAAHYLSL